MKEDRSARLGGDDSLESGGDADHVAADAFEDPLADARIVVVPVAQAQGDPGAVRIGERLGEMEEIVVEFSGQD